MGINLLMSNPVPSTMNGLYGQSSPSPYMPFTISPLTGSSILVGVCGGQVSLLGGCRAVKEKDGSAFCQACSSPLMPFVHNGRFMALALAVHWPLHLYFSWTTLSQSIISTKSIWSMWEFPVLAVLLVQTSLIVG